MDIFYKFKKILFLFVFCAQISIFAQNGVEIQTDALSNFVGSYLDASHVSCLNCIDSYHLSKQIQEKAVNLGFDLIFKVEKENDKQYVFSGLNRITGSQICSITITEKKSSFDYNVNLDLGNDGCIKDAQSGSLFVNRPLEVVFAKNSDHVDIVDAKNFICSDKNIYKVIRYPGLFQGSSGPCGYYALNNILMAYFGLTKVDQLLDRPKFEPFFASLIGYNLGKIDSVSNNEMYKIIKNNLKELDKSNIVISVEKINDLNCLRYEKLMTFGSKDLLGSDIIRDFQINGNAQYLIVNTGQEKSDQSVSINGLTLNWDNSYDRLYCLENHWIVLKIEWQDPSKPGSCPVILSIFDSSGPRDNRFATLIHWYYYVFVHSLV